MKGSIRGDGNRARRGKTSTIRRYQPDILAFYLIRLSGTRTLRRVIEFIINFRRTAISRGNEMPRLLVPVISTLFQPGDSISISSRPEVSREWLLSHFRTKKKSNERTMEPAGYWKGTLGWCTKKTCSKEGIRVPLRHSCRTLPIILENVSTFLLSSSSRVSLFPPRFPLRLHLSFPSFIRRVAYPLKRGIPLSHS